MKEFSYYDYIKYTKFDDCNIGIDCLFCFRGVVLKIDKQIVGQRIKAIREKRRLTLEQFARIIDRDKQTVWRWEKAERGVSINMLNLIAEKLDCNPSYLLGYSDDITELFEPESGNGLSFPTNDHHFGKNVRTTRKKQGLSIEELASRLSVPEAYVTEMENLRETPESSDLRRIARALGVSSNSLLAQSNIPTTIIPPPNAFVVELAMKIMEIDPYILLYLRNTKPTDAEARFIASAIRLAFEKSVTES
jgi:transcriptional regulator with XRE-family HTH domain